MTTTTIDLTHAVQVLHDNCPDSLGYRAECGCGWTGPWRDDQPDASSDAVEHREVAVGPGDGLDRVMGELLDTQDDLATVVVWLAENWSADLPVPTMYGTGSGHSGPVKIELWACADTPTDVNRIAHLLGVPAIDDETPNSIGYRYRQAVRSFGRVTIKAFAAIDNPLAT